MSKQLEIEHARYKKALQAIKGCYLPGEEAYKWSEAALNPPILPLPTIAELCLALREKNNKDGARHNITFFSDKSGNIKDGRRKEIFSFSCLREALDFLKGGSHE